MAQEEVGILITARNISGAAFRGLSNSIRGIENQTTGLQTQLNNIPRAIGSSFQRSSQAYQQSSKQLIGMNAALLGVGATIGGVALGFNQLNESIGNAVTRQVENVAAINTVVATLGLTSNEAEGFVESFNKSVAELGRALPTSSENIAIFSRSIIDDYAIGLKSAGLGVDQISNQLLEDSSRLALAADLAGSTILESQTAIGAFLSGSLTSGGFNQYKFFQNNIQLRNALSSGLEDAGVKSTKDLSQKNRVQLLTKALEEAIPDDAIERLQGTTKAKISSFMDTLFNPEIGVFSIQRDLEPKIPGYQSVFSEFETTFDLLIGDEGLLAEFGRITGLKNDSFLNRFKDSVEGFNLFLTGVTDTFSGIEVGDFNAVAGNIGSYAAGLVNGIVNGLVSLPWGDILSGLVTGIGQFFLDLDWKVYTGLALGLVGAFLAPALTGAITAIGAGILAGLAAAGVGLPAILVGAVTLGIVGIGKLITDNWASITQTVIDWSARIKDSITGLFSSILDSIRGLFSGSDVTENTNIQTYNPGSAYGFYMGHIPNVLTASGGLFGAIQAESRNKPSGSNLVIANDSEAIFTPTQLRNLISNVSNRGSKQVSININSGAIQINSQSGNAQEIAYQVINMIEQRLASELNSLIG